MNDLFTTHIKEPDVWESKGGGGGLTLLGLPFILLGFFAVVGAIGYAGAEGEAGGAPWELRLGIGLLFISFGSVFVFGRFGVTIDRRSRKIIKWVGLIVPLASREFPTDSFELVTIGRETRSSGRAPNAVYPIRLRGAFIPRPLEIEISADYRTAMMTAEELAGFLGKPLVDSSMGTPVVRDPEEQYTPAGDKARARANVPGVPDPPPLLLSNIMCEGEEGTETVVDIPPRGFRSTGYLSLAVGTIVPAFIAVKFLIPLGRTAGSTEDVVFLAILSLFVLVPTIVTWTGAFREARKVVRVSASPLALTIEETGLVKTRSWTLPAKEIEEFYVNDGLPIEAAAHPHQDRTEGAGEHGGTGMKSSGGFITVSSDETTLKFGFGLSIEELGYIHAVIKNAITG
jgi:hypothetical protein